MGLIDKDVIKPKVQEKLLKACTRLYEAERALCEIAVPQSWKDEAKAAWEEFVYRYQDYELIIENCGDISDDNLNYDDYGIINKSALVAEIGLKISYIMSQRISKMLGQKWL